MKPVRRRYNFADILQLFKIVLCVGWFGWILAVFVALHLAVQFIRHNIYLFFTADAFTNLQLFVIIC